MILVRPPSRTSGRCISIRFFRWIWSSRIEGSLRTKRARRILDGRGRRWDLAASCRLSCRLRWGLWWWCIDWSSSYWQDSARCYRLNRSRYTKLFGRLGLAEGKTMVVDDIASEQHMPAIRYDECLWWYFGLAHRFAELAHAPETLYFAEFPIQFD